MHMKGTLVRQAASSTYKMTEARLGGRLTRQDVNVAQVGHIRVRASCFVGVWVEALSVACLEETWLACSRAADTHAKCSSPCRVVMCWAN